MSRKKRRRNWILVSLILSSLIIFIAYSSIFLDKKFSGCSFDNFPPDYRLSCSWSEIEASSGQEICLSVTEFDLASPKSIVTECVTASRDGKMFVPIYGYKIHSSYFYLLQLQSADSSSIIESGYVENGLIVESKN